MKLYEKANTFVLKLQKITNVKVKKNIEQVPTYSFYSNKYYQVPIR